MHRPLLAALMTSLLLAGAAGCGPQSDSPAPAPTCGAWSQACCASGAACGAGLACHVGTCLTGAAACGAESQACCASDVPCATGLACQAGTCRSGAAACGGSSQACCASGTACASGLACQSGACLFGSEACGAESQACCASGTACGSGLACQSGACLFGSEACGAESQACCASGTACGSGLACQAGTCQPADAACGAAGQACCASGTACASGLACQAGACQAGAACGAVNQACCAGATACVTGAACQADACLPTSVTASICAAGGTLTVYGGSLAIPQGALADCATLTLASSTAAVPDYAAFSPVVTLAPATDFAKPARLTMPFGGEASRATIFGSRPGTTGFARAVTEITGGSATAGTAAASLTHVDRAFVADGVAYVDRPDRSCVVGKLVEGRTMPPSAVALFFTVDDCWNRPVTGLAAGDFAFLEDGAPVVASESSATILDRNGVQAVVTILVDLSASTSAFLPDVIAGAKAFVNRAVVKRLPVRFGIQLFAGESAVTTWQEPTLDTAAVLGRLDDLAALSPTAPPLDRPSTNLYGAILASLGDLDAAQAALRDANRGGAIPTGYLVVFTDGRDTAGRVKAADVVAAEASSADQVLAVAVRGPEYDEAALSAIAPNGLITVAAPAQLTTAFSALANRMEGQIASTYLLGYCSPRRAGASNQVAVDVSGAEDRKSAGYAFDASAFQPGCSAATFVDACKDKECGGLACGACGADRACSAATDRCVAAP